MTNDKIQMTKEERENLRIALLSIAETNQTRFGLPALAFRLHAASRYGFQGASVEEIERELDYLTGKKLLEEIAKHLSPENRAWRISVEGRDFVATHA